MPTMVPPHIQQMADSGALSERTYGAALVVDAEGSTALAQQLQRHGLAGAELLADVLKNVFTPMVEIVGDTGGYIAEFAGDGILAVFPGELAGAVDRAVSAGQRIIAALGRLGDVETPDGSVRLSVRSVVGAGSLESIVWVSENVDVAQQAAYVYRGTAVAEAQRGESLIPGGVLAIGPEACRRMSLDARTQPVADGFVAIVDAVPSAALHVAGAVDPVSGRVPFFPSSLGSVPVLGEFRGVVSAFVELRHLPDQTTESQMVKFLDLLAEHRGYLCNVVSPDSDAEGVRVLVFWGAPTSRERDIGYALRFVADLGIHLGQHEVRAGITRGTVFAGFVGTESLASYTCIGSQVNLAARMCAAADWGQIRVDEQIRNRLAAPWVVEDLGAVSYRGFEGDVSTYSVTTVPPVRRPDPFRGAFVGRSHELDLLEDALAGLWAGRSVGIVAVTGEAGSGKSRLIAELRGRLTHRIPGPTWLEAQADEIRSQPFATLRDALSGYLGRPGAPDTAQRLDAYIARLSAGSPDMSTQLERSKATLADFLDVAGDEVPQRTLEPKDRFEDLVLAVKDLILAVERFGPVIVVVADAQWIDEGTAEVLTRIQSDMGNGRLGMIIETRDREVGISANHVVEMSALALHEIADLTREFLGRSPSPELVAFISERSGGNAFYARQLLEYLQRRGLLDVGTDLDVATVASGIPLDLRHVLVSRLDGLPVSVRRNVQIASVLGREVDLRILALMSEAPDRMDADVKVALDSRVWDIDEEGRIAAFRNLLIRDAAYGMLSYAEARTLHKVAAEGIKHIHGSDERSAAKLAYHYDRAGMPSTAVRHYLTAAKAAMARYANAEAVDHLDRAHELSDPADTDTNFEILKLRFAVHDTLGDRDAQQVDLDAMATLAVVDPPSTAEIAILRGRLLSALGSYAEAESVVSSTIRDVGDDIEANDLGALVFLLAQIARYRGHNEDAQIRAGEARSIFESVDDQVGVASADDLLGGIAWDQGDFGTAATLHRSAANAFEVHGRAIDEIRALNNLGSAIFATGDYSEARRIHEAGAKRSREIGYLMGEGDHLDNAGGTAWAVGDYNLAGDLYSKALAIRERMGDTWGVAISKGNLGATRRDLGHPHEGLTLYREALEIDRKIGRRRGEAYDLHGMGLCQLDLKRYNLAYEALGQSAVIRSELGERHLANESKVACAVALLRIGDVSAAVSLVESVLDAEGSNLFEGAVETTASLLRCVEVLETTDAIRAEELKAFAARRVVERAERISDAADRQSYLELIDAHIRAASAD